MGLASQKEIEDHEKGFCSGSDKRVCHKHFDDYAIKGFIKRKSDSSHCDFCEEEDPEDIEFGYKEESLSIAFDDLMEFIMRGIKRHYDDPGNHLGWESKEGGWIGTVWDSEELVNDEINLVGDNYDLQEEIIESMGRMQEWCVIHPYSLSESEILNNDWDIFCRTLKHEMRYIIYKNPIEIKSHPYSGRTMTDILDDIGDFIRDFNLLRNTAKGSELFEFYSFFRAQSHERHIPKTAKRLGSPPNEFAKANRFSPAGISMFYGAKDSKTAIAEIKKYVTTEKLITVAEFAPYKDLNLIDLTKIKMISMFDEENAHLYDASIFLLQFARAMSEPIDRDGLEHFKYVPTQVVTEYFKYVLPSVLNKPVNGMIYKSSVVDKGVCYVIFCNNDECCDEGKEGKYLLYLKKESVNTETL